MSGCIVCGREHPAVVGEPGSFLAGVELTACPDIPEDFIYVDEQFDSGPPGRLLDLRPHLDAA